jgi:hypothetical protein
MNCFIVASFLRDPSSKVASSKFQVEVSLCSRQFGTRL